jgi:ATP phosphoribosyltransferase
LKKTDSDVVASTEAAALKFAQAEMAAAAAKERRGDKGDDTMSGADLVVAVKFVHLKKAMKEWSL